MNAAMGPTRMDFFASMGQQVKSSDCVNGSDPKPEKQGQPDESVQNEIPSQSFTQSQTVPEVENQSAPGQSMLQTGLEDTASVPVTVPPAVAIAASIRSSAESPFQLGMPEPMVNSKRAGGYVDSYQYFQPESFASTSIASQSPTQRGDAMSELQNRSLAASRVRLLDATIDILVTTFKNKYALDKGLEKRCAKSLGAAELETGDKTLKDGLEILAGSSQWVKENLETLEHCLREKRRNVQIARPLIDAKYEKKKEDKQIKAIQKVARKIRERVAKRQKGDMRFGGKSSEAKMVTDAWNQLPPADGQGRTN